MKLTAQEMMTVFREQQPNLSIDQTAEHGNGTLVVFGSYVPGAPLRFVLEPNSRGFTINGHPIIMEAGAFKTERDAAEAARQRQLEVEGGDDATRKAAHERAVEGLPPTPPPAVASPEPPPTAEREWGVDPLLVETTKESEPDPAPNVEEKL